MQRHKWPICFFACVAIWNMIGAGLFGFMISPTVFFGVLASAHLCVTFLTILSRNPDMLTLDPEQTVGDFVRQKPTRARVFESLKIDDAERRSSNVKPTRCRQNKWFPKPVPKKCLLECLRVNYTKCFLTVIQWFMASRLPVIACSFAPANIYSA